MCSEDWWRLGESNSWPLECKSNALPTELSPHQKCWKCALIWEEMQVTISAAKFLFDNSGLRCFFIGAMLVACGPNKTPKKEVIPATKIERDFSLSSEKNGIPLRFLLAVAQLESRLNPNPAIALYGNKASGPESQQTAFGLSRKTLGIESHAEADQLSVQVEAYAQWLASKIADLHLPKNPQSAEEKFTWIWAIAQQQRLTQPPQRNLQALFARELIDTLNQGFTLTSHEDGVILQFPKEAPELLVRDLRQVSQDLLALNTRQSQAFSASRFPLSYGTKTVTEAIPSGIEVIHCPFALSSCLNLISGDPGALPLQTHYVIPSDNRVVQSPLQVAEQDVPLLTIRADGVVEQQNKIFIMLTGLSGKITNGIRSDANPAWISKQQLYQLGELISHICNTIEEKYQDKKPFKDKECSTVGKFVHFRAPNANELYHWGEISDFDSNIFTTYAQSATGLGGETSFQFASPEQIYEAGAPIQFQLHFQPSVQQLTIERLVRCPNHQVVWSTVAKEEARALTSLSFEKALWDAGPNGNGEQYFRAKVYEKDGSLLGWASARVLLKHFEPTQVSAENSECPKS